MLETGIMSYISAMSFLSASTSPRMGLMAISVCLVRADSIMFRISSRSLVVKLIKLF
jgi:hypothetical protein